MLTKPYGVSPSVEISIGGVNVRYESIVSVSLLLEESKHDLLEMVIAGFPPGAVTDYWNSPVKVVLDNGASFYYEFIGYIDGVHPTSSTSQGFVNYSPIQSATLVCLGASYAMRGSNTRGWSNHRLESIVASLSVNYGFSSDCIKKGKVYEALVQTGESDWKFLTRAADIQGLSVNCHGTHLHVYDPYSAYSRRNSFHVLHTLVTSGNDPTPSPGQILDLKGSFRKQLTSQTSVLMPNGKTVDLKDSNSTAMPLLSRTGTYDTSVSQGIARINSTRKQSYDHSMKATVLGLAGCLPGGVVKVVDYDNAIDGYWYVKSVKHSIANGDFLSELSITRNVDNELVPTNTATFKLNTDSYFDGKRWVARKRTNSVYS